MTDQGPPQPTPIYVSYLTFTNLLDWLRDLGTLPSQFDRSFWGQKFSGSGGGQLMAGLRWLKLLNGDRPEERFETLALASNEKRRELIIDLLRDAYGAEFIDSLPKSTPRLINERLAALGTSGATHDKARSFFINAAKAVGLPLPPMVAKQARNRPTVSRKGGKGKGSETAKVEPKDTGVGSGTPSPHPPVDPRDSQIPESVIAVVRRLPVDEGAWTETDRERWLRALTATVDLEFELIQEL